jgi:hypothetical protein
MSVLELFCAADDFCVAFFKEYPKQQVADGRKHRQRARSLCESKIMTILLCGLIAYCHQPKKPSLGLSAFPTLVAP